MSATSNEAATGTWIVVARNAAAPTSAQVKAAAAYSGVAIVASGSGAMSAAVARAFAVTGLAAGTNYDVYVVAEDGSANLSTPPVKAQLATLFAPVTSYTGTPPGVAGSVTASFTGGGAACGYTPGQFVAGSSLPSAPPGGIAFPQGLFQFAIGNCTPGSTLSFTIAYAQPLPANAQYWKYGKTPGNATPHWYTLTVADNALNISGSTVTFNITDGGLGDDDVSANGQISDPGGSGAPSGASNATGIPTLSEWGMMLLSGLMALFGWVQMRRRNG
ncbi:MAG: IPTL-CTERM sorting domain-containing protein [Betaproteobacteria bacterium]|nr:IPTL-CTERM sorting domain-containing protein [Betaproteobacteria bacterium]